VQSLRLKFHHTPPLPVQPHAHARRKKKFVAEESDSDHGDFDPNALREHEEFTKVRRCQPGPGGSLK